MIKKALTILIVAIAFTLTGCGPSVRRGPSLAEETARLSKEIKGTTPANTQLLRACFASNVQEINLALQNGADPDARSSEGISALRFCTLWNKTEEGAQILIKRSANTNVTDPETGIPLIEAAEDSKMPNLVKALKEAAKK